MSTERDERTFDWRARFDPRSLQYRAAPAAAEMPTTGVLWATGPTLDQGAEGACCGFGATGAVMAEPSGRLQPATAATKYARGWYKRAQRLDEWPGEQYDGTSVLATCLVGRERRLWSGFRWAKNPAELAAGIVDPQLGPAILGVAWAQELYETDRAGVMRARDLDGDLGHCVLAFGYLPAPEHISDPLWDELEELGLTAAVESLDEPSYPILNSWGPDYGRGGRAVAPVSLVRRWFARRGEFALPEDRTRRGATMAAGEQDETDGGTEGRDVTLHITVDELRDGDRVLDPPEELGQESATVRGTPRLVTAHGGRQVLVPTVAGQFPLSSGAPVTVRRRKADAAE